MSASLSTATARARFIRTSPQKLNLVAQLIRGLKVEKALVTLANCPRRVSNEVYKVLRSAIANAENNNGLDVDNLIVDEAFVGKAFTMKRFQPRAKGRAGKVTKPFSKLTITLKENRN